MRGYAGNGKSYLLFVRLKTCLVTVEIDVENSLKLKIDTPCDPGISPLSKYSTKNSTENFDTHSSILYIIAVFLTWKQVPFNDIVWNSRHT